MNQRMMRAIVLDEAGPASNLQLREIPLPDPAPGWVRIRVESRGLNRSELMTRQGLSGDAVSYPRVLGIEATGIVDLDRSGTFESGQQVMTMMGGMGRTFDGGYAEYTCVPIAQVIPFQSKLDWATLGAIPEMLQTAQGSLTIGLNAQPGQSLLIRGGTSSIGMATAVLAKRLGMTVISTTRSPNKTPDLIDIGVDHVLIDDGNVAAQVRAMLPHGVDAALELIGTPTLPDTLRATRVHGVVCFTGMLSGKWTVEEFYPIDYLPQGVRLTAYSGTSDDLSAETLHSILDEIAAGHFRVPIDSVYPLEHMAQAHARIESGVASGKIVVINTR